MVPATPALCRQIEQVASAYLERRYCGPGNPMGTQIHRDGDVFATKVTFAPGNSQMNGVHGLERAAQLPPVLDFYATTDQPCWIDVTPHADIELTTALCRAGFRPDSYGSVLFASPIPSVDLPSVTMEAVGPAGRDEFLDTLNRGFGMPESLLAGLRRNQSFWCDVADWHLLLARVDGAPAAAAVLSLHDDIGYLAAGATLAEFRNHGLHAALIAARLDLARQLGCRMVTGQAAAGSISDRNQQRCGLHIAHTKCIWSNRHRLAPPSH